MNVEDDRLSNLPDELIHIILSFVSLRQAIRTSILSSRWRHMWTSMSYLNFSPDDFIPNFVSNVVSRRNNQIQVSSVKLVPRVPISQECVKIILDYTFSHNVQQLSVTCDHESNVGFPLSSFRSRNLKHITLSGSLYASSPIRKTPTWDLPALTTLHLDHITLSDRFIVLFSTCTNLKNLSLSRCDMMESLYTSSLFLKTPTWDLPTLTTLHLDHITLSDKFNDLFSKCTNLKNLSLRRCTMMGTIVLNICHPHLSDLTLSNITFEYTYPYLTRVRVGAPRMMIFAPCLTSLVMKVDRPLELTTDGFRCLENVNLCIYNKLFLKDAHRIAFMLQQLRSVKLLTLNLEILELLSSSMNLIYHQPYVFPNVKILNFTKSFPVMVCLEVQAQEKVTMSTEIKNHDSYPSDIFTMVSYEEIIVMKRIVSAQTLMEDLRGMLKSNKRKTHEQVKKQWAESSLDLQCYFRKMMAQIEQGKIEELMKKMPKSETRYMVSRLHKMFLWLQKIFPLLHCIEGLVNELPVSKKAMLQATFSSQCEDAVILLNNVLGLYKDLMDEGMRLINGFLDDKVNLKKV